MIRTLDRSAGRECQSEKRELPNAHHQAHLKSLKHA